MDREQIEEDFEFLKEVDEVLAVLVFGSQVKGESHERSDTDICIVVPDAEPWDILSEVYPEVDVEKKGYDVKVFEELTLRLKNSVIQNHEIVWTRDYSRLQEYLFRFRKLWNDQSKNWINA
ncbi:MAG: nucleotidyltransferase domain-containing protein [Candidatus Nanohalobium sp.]